MRAAPVFIVLENRPKTLMWFSIIVYQQLLNTLLVNDIIDKFCKIEKAKIRFCFQTLFIYVCVCV